MKHYPTEGQTAVDIALQYTGSVEAAFDLAAEGVPVDGSPEGLEAIELPELATNDAGQYLLARGIRINAGMEKAEDVPLYAITTHNGTYITTTENEYITER